MGVLKEEERWGALNGDVSLSLRRRRRDGGGPKWGTPAGAGGRERNRLSLALTLTALTGEVELTRLSDLPLKRP